MGFNEYAEDSWIYGDSYDYDDQMEEYEPYEFDEETWQDWHSEDLLNMWMSICEYRENLYIRDKCLQNATYSSFCEWAYKNS